MKVFLKNPCRFKNSLYLYVSNNNKRKTKMKELTLIAKGIKVTKVCKNEREVAIFYRDMPAKYRLLFQTEIAYAIQEKEIK